MEKIPTPPYLEYANKYKIMKTKELETSKDELESNLWHSRDKWVILRAQGEGDEEYQAWVQVRFLTAELGILQSCLTMQSLFDETIRMMSE